MSKGAPPANRARSGKIISGALLGPILNSRIGLNLNDADGHGGGNADEAVKDADALSEAQTRR